MADESSRCERERERERERDQFAAASSSPSAAIGAADGGCFTGWFSDRIVSVLFSLSSLHLVSAYLV